MSNGAALCEAQRSWSAFQAGTMLAWSHEDGIPSIAKMLLRQWHSGRRPIFGPAPSGSRFSSSHFWLPRAADFESVPSILVSMARAIPVGMDAPA